MSAISRSRATASPLATFAVAATLLLGGMSLLAHSSAGAATVKKPSHTIIISNFMFAPMTLSVSPGTVITVTNHDTVVHTLSALGGKFNTGHLQHNQTKTFRAPMKKGVYHFQCDIHQFMMGTLRVT